MLAATEAGADERECKRSAAGESEAADPGAASGEDQLWTGDVRLNFYLKILFFSVTWIAQCSDCLASYPLVANAVLPKQGTLCLLN